MSDTQCEFIANVMLNFIIKEMEKIKEEITEHLLQQEQRGIIGSNIDGIILQSEEQPKQSVEELRSEFEKETTMIGHRFDDGVHKGLFATSYVMWLESKLLTEYTQQKEVSDEDIEKEAEKLANTSGLLTYTDKEIRLGKIAFFNGAKWMREKLKTK